MRPLRSPTATCLWTSPWSAPTTPRPSCSRYAQEQTASLAVQLLSNTLAAPEIVVTPSEPTPELQGHPDSILASLTNVASTVPTALFQIPYRIYKYIFSDVNTVLNTEEGEAPGMVHTHSNLKRLAALLLLTLLVYRPTGRNSNPYSEALTVVRDYDDPTVFPADQLCRGASVGFQALYDAMCEQLPSDPQLLVLYQLLWRSRSFRDFAIHVRTDIDSLLLPLARCVYDSSDPDTPSDALQPARLSVSLSCAMMLSENDAFNANAQSTVVEAVPWCVERVVMDTPLSSVLLIVLLRAVYTSLHSHAGHAGGTLCTCLAAIANMAPHMKEMHPYAAQRLVQLLEILAKKVGRLYELQVSGAAEEEQQELEEEVHFFQELSQMLLDVFHVLLIRGGEPAANPHLVYALLHRHKEVLSRLRVEPFNSMPALSEGVNNIAVLSAKLHELIPQDVTDVEAVHEVISAHANRLAREQRAPGQQESRENYVYDEQAGVDEFFAPYLWQVIVKNSGVKWSESRIMLFQVPSA
eukprot:TRINITY_DN12756_c0_g1_i3.p1 TRINITY_DN12756_c0_g1~~TRINITY_DN12756_c0_g1_i3.p1  ORF type:complete len:524 (-),score=138.04 TRINITY_DN12756_c0_g1_i3:231-1802(-)